MAGSVNKVIIVGNVGKDPEIRAMQSGDRVANLSVATSERWKDRNGERQERTEWHRLVVFSQPLIGIVEQYVKKGSKVYIEGQLETRKWTDGNGVEKYATEVVLRPFSSTLTLLDSRDGSAAPAQQAQQSYGGGIDEMEDEIPFSPHERGIFA